MAKFYSTGSKFRCFGWRNSVNWRTLWDWQTTLFNIISGFYEPVSGSVIFNGKYLLSKPPWKRPVSTMFQSDNLFPHLSVRAESNVRNK